MKLTIPYYLHKAGAGFPSPATDYIEEDIDLNVHLIKNVPATFIIRVQGKSMVNVGNDYKKPKFEKPAVNLTPPKKPKKKGEGIFKKFLKLLKLGNLEELVAI